MTKFAIAMLLDETFPKYDRAEQVVSLDGRNVVTKLFRGDEVIAEFSLPAGAHVPVRTRIDVFFEEAENEVDAAKQAVARIVDVRVLSAIARPIP